MNQPYLSFRCFHGALKVLLTLAKIIATSGPLHLLFFLSHSNMAGFFLTDQVSIHLLSLGAPKGSHLFYFLYNVYHLKLSYLCTCLPSVSSAKM